MGDDDNGQLDLGEEMTVALREVPEDFRPFLEVMLPVIKVMGDQAAHFDHRQPSTTIRRFESQLQEAFQRGIGTADPEAVTRRVVAMVGGPDLFTRLEAMWDPKTSDDAGLTDPHHVALQTFIDDCAARQPVAWVRVLQVQAEDLRSHLEAMDALERLHGATGEARVRDVLSAIADSMEPLYHPYLSKLWMLDYASRGELAPPPPALGALVTDLHERLAAHPGLVDARAARLRNAKDHYQWKYDPDTDTVDVWEVNRRGQETSRENLTPGQLEAVLDNVITLGGGGFLKARTRYISRLARNLDLLGTLEELLQRNFSGDECTFEDVLKRRLAERGILPAPVS